MDEHSAGVDDFNADDYSALHFCILIAGVDDMNADDYAARHFCILTRLSPFAASEWPHIQTRQVASTQVSYSLNICEMSNILPR